MPFLAADIASVGPLTADTRVLLTTLVALGVTILVPLIALVVSLLWEISLLPLVVEIPLPPVLSELSGTLCIGVAGLGSSAVAQVPPICLGQSMDLRG